MKFDINKAISKAVLVFLVGGGVYTILRNLDLPGESNWIDFVAGAMAVGLVEIFFNFQKNKDR